ncbi:unnamed protein product [Cochlearia groenlandica]
MNRWEPHQAKDEEALTENLSGDDYVRKSDFEALIKALKGSGKVSGTTLHALRTNIDYRIKKPIVIDYVLLTI